MRNIQGLPLADPSSDSLGKLNRQYPGLFYVACASNVGVICVATSRANKLQLASTAGRFHNPTFEHAPTLVALVTAVLILSGVVSRCCSSARTLDSTQAKPTQASKPAAKRALRHRQVVGQIGRAHV